MKIILLVPFITCNLWAQDAEPTDPIKPSDATQAAFWKADSLMRTFIIYSIQEGPKRDAEKAAAQSAMEKSCAEHSQTLDLTALQQGDVKCRIVEKVKAEDKK